MAACGMCGIVKVAVIGTLVGGLALGVAGMSWADDKPVQTKPAQSKPAETKPADDSSKEDEGKKVDPKTEEPKKEEVKVDAYVLDHDMKDIDGTDTKLSTYKGKVVLMVNVASKCGFTTQYTGLQKLWEDKKDAGLVVVGFPANDFGRQEPGSETEIKEFCTNKYSVTFPMFSKVIVKGNDMCPLYKDLTSQPSPIGGEIGWNFTKFLVDRKGNVVARYDSRVKPDDAEMLKKIEELLKAE